MDMQSFEEEFGSKIKLPNSIVKIWSALGMAGVYRFRLLPSNFLGQNNICP